MLTPVKEQRDRLAQQYRELGGAIFQRQNELATLQERHRTLAVAIGALNDTIRETEEGCAAAEALANITKP